MYKQCNMTLVNNFVVHKMQSKLSILSILSIYIYILENYIIYILELYIYIYIYIYHNNVI